jgi:hypothetical protein
VDRHGRFRTSCRISRLHGKENAATRLARSETAAAALGSSVRWLWACL